MVDVLRPPTRHPGTRLSSLPTSGLLGRAAKELRELAYDVVGRPEHDELSPEEHRRLALEVEQVVAAVLAEHATPADASRLRVTSHLSEMLVPRIEALPAHVRAALANARRRQMLGFD